VELCYSLVGLGFSYLFELEQNEEESCKRKKGLKIEVDKSSQMVVK
jgi:hypothetical protein